MHSVRAPIRLIHAHSHLTRPANIFPNIRVELTARGALLGKSNELVQIMTCRLHGLSPSGGIGVLRSYNLYSSSWMQCSEFVWLLRDSLNLRCRWYARESTRGSVACARQEGRAHAIEPHCRQTQRRLAKTAELGIAAQKSSISPLFMYTTVRSV